MNIWFVVLLGFIVIRLPILSQWRNTVISYVRVSRFGVEPTMVATMWDISITHTNFSSGAKLVHLLWSLNFLKIFDSVHGFFGVDEKTYRQWMWPIIQCIASMSVVHKKEKYGWLLCFIGWLLCFFGWLLCCWLSLTSFGHDHHQNRSISPIVLSLLLTTCTRSWRSTERTSL